MYRKRDISQKILLSFLWSFTNFSSLNAKQNISFLCWEAINSTTQSKLKIREREISVNKTSLQDK